MDTTQKPQEMAQDQNANELGAENLVPEPTNPPAIQEESKNEEAGFDADLPQSPAPAESETLVAEEQASDNA